MPPFPSVASFHIDALFPNVAGFTRTGFLHRYPVAGFRVDVLFPNVAVFQINGLFPNLAEFHIDSLFPTARVYVGSLFSNVTRFQIDSSFQVSNRNGLSSRCFGSIVADFQIYAVFPNVLKLQADAFSQNATGVSACKRQFFT